MPILQGGREALEANLENFRRFGLVTTEQATALKALEQSYTDLGTVLRTGLASAVAESAGAFATLNRQLSESLPRAINRVVEAVALLVRNLDTVVNIAAVLFGVFVFSRFRPIILGFLAVATGARGARIAVIAFGRALLTVLRRFVLPALIIEGLFIIVQGFRNLIRNVEAFGTSMTDVALVASADFVAIIVSALLSLPAAIAAILVAIGGVLVEGFVQLGAAAREALFAGLRGENIGEAFLESFDLGDIAERALELRRNVRSMRCGWTWTRIACSRCWACRRRKSSARGPRSGRPWTIPGMTFARCGKATQDENPLEFPVPEVPDDILEIPADLLEGLEGTLEQVETLAQRVAREMGDAFGRFADVAISDFASIGDAARQLGGTSCVPDQRAHNGAAHGRHHESAQRLSRRRSRSADRRPGLRGPALHRRRGRAGTFRARPHRQRDPERRARRGEQRRDVQFLAVRPAGRDRGRRGAGAGPCLPAVRRGDPHVRAVRSRPAVPVQQGAESLMPQITPPTVLLAALQSRHHARGLPLAGRAGLADRDRSDTGPRLPAHGSAPRHSRGSVPSARTSRPRHPPSSRSSPRWRGATGSNCRGARWQPGCRVDVVSRTVNADGNLVELELDGELDDAVIGTASAPERLFSIREIARSWRYRILDPQRPLAINERWRDRTRSSCTANSTTGPGTVHDRWTSPGRGQD